MPVFSFVLCSVVLSLKERSRWTEASSVVTSSVLCSVREGHGDQVSVVGLCLGSGSC